MLQRLFKKGEKSAKGGARLGREFNVGDMLEQRYEVEQVRRGYMGIVYIAYDRQRRQRVVIKTFQNKFLWDEEAIARFSAEAELWVRLGSHANIVCAYDLRTFLDTVVKRASAYTDDYMKELGSVVGEEQYNQEAAWEFAKWLTSKEFGLAAVKYPSATSAIHSPRVSVLTDPASRQVLPYVDALVESLKIAKERPRLREYADVQEHLRVTAGKLTAGELALDAALREIDAGTNRILGK